MQTVSLFLNSRKLQSQKGSFTTNYAIFLSNSYMVKEGGCLHGGSLEVEAGLIGAVVGERISSKAVSFSSEH